MRNRFTLILGVVLALCGAAAQGQEGAQPGPSPEMRKLDFLVGKLTIKGKLYPPNGTPSELTGTAETTWAMGGRYLQIQSTFQRETGSARETLRLIGYDPQAKQYRAWSFTSGGPMASEWRGNFEGERLVLTLQPNLADGVGISAIIDPAPEGVQVLGVEPGGPAEKAGLKAGDLITRIDGIAAGPVTPGRALALRGKVGTPVRLTVRSGTQEREITVTRHVAPLTRVIMEPRSKSESQVRFETEQEGRWVRMMEQTFSSAYRTLKRRKRRTDGEPIGEHPLHRVLSRPFAVGKPSQADKLERT